MNIKINKEQPIYFGAIDEINDLAFGQPQESRLIKSLRKLDDYIPELSLIAFEDDKAIGHILFFPIYIEAEQQKYQTLSLAPMAVLPGYQNKGVGGELIRHGLSQAKTLGFDSVLVLGHPKYYPKFGFEKASKWKIKCPWDAPDEAWMVLELKTGVLEGKAGMAVFPNEYEEAV